VLCKNINEIVIPHFPTHLFSILTPRHFCSTTHWLTWMTSPNKMTPVCIRKNHCRTSVIIS